MTNDHEKIQALLLKLKAMAERGEAHERDVAQIKLDDLIAKYNLEPGKAKNDKRIFKVRDWAEHKNLLLQCIIDVKANAKMEGDKTGKKIYVELEDLEYIEVCEKWDYYWKEFLIQKEGLFTAFVVKNKIGTNGNDEKNTDLNEDRISETVKFMAVIDQKKFANKNKNWFKLILNKW